ncbi:hypothetical protein C2869_17470 [Saccharobesus litoralis]|uniref:M23ase beta-sheet core domain-containing protein n=1 Tax=Saccharobesus litoralis TaxID=2172099 RepID=A0A2S0VV58_9ALTE|nr:Ig-like domain-containing protein [Saccharobesus litoralis]AWB68101.1 hypothetical protein C2869_17470 [Saccharobesus litoralis]
MQAVKSIVTSTLLGLVSTTVVASPGHQLNVSSFVDANYQNVEPAYQYDFVAPIAADILQQAPDSYTPSYSHRYFTSIFGPRYKYVSSSNVEYFDFHKGMDFTAVVQNGGQNFDEITPPSIVSRCDGVISKIVDGNLQEMESTGEGRYVEVMCDQTFNGNNWGNIYMAYRHLESVENGLQVGQDIDKGDVVGLMGETGHTSTVHLHYSVMRHNGQTRVNVNPMRTFDPLATPHLHAHLQSAEISQLDHDIDSAMFRVILPYQQTAIRALTISLDGGNYSRTYDFEAVSEHAGDLRDNNDYVQGLELFAYPYNRGQTNYARYVDKMAQMPQSYPASSHNDHHHHKPFINRSLNTEPGYALDIRVSDLPFDFDISQLKIELIDVYGYGVRAYGQADVDYPSIVFWPLQHDEDDAEQRESGAVDLHSSDLELVNDGSKGDQLVGLRFAELNLPANANIQQAYVQFSVDETDDENTQLSIQVEDSIDSLAFVDNDFDLSNRTRSLADVAWQPDAWQQVDATQAVNATPDLSSLVNSLVSKQGWNEDSAVTLLISGTGKRVADSADGSLRKAPYIYLEYDQGQPANQAPVVSLTSPAQQSDQIGLANVGITANAADSDGSVSTVTFYVNNVEVGVDNSAPYEMQWQPNSYGQYSIYAIAEDDLGLTSQSTTHVINLVQNQIEVAISAGNDDAEQRESGSIARNGSDLELGYDTYVSSKYGPSAHQHVGLRFAAVNIPANATITRAYVQFTSTKTENDDVDLLIEAQNSGDAEGFGYSQFNISSRGKVPTSVAWQPAPWTGSNLNGEAQQTPDLSAMLQQVISHPDWQAGNAMVLTIHSPSQPLVARTARSYNGNAAQAPKLIVEFSN